MSGTIFIPYCVSFRGVIYKRAAGTVLLFPTKSTTSIAPPSVVLPTSLSPCQTRKGASFTNTASVSFVGGKYKC